ncbi:hypothetical protein OPKNFCMD_6343 [Methylobacterium crusticola]|uniref:Uncharacterized protein n=1 Tax=Methylobacterium crusticola TaxID=1697972 RepID=A0ABQ4R784_9HYPH|nr:hypothetical protein OPKNFCMD_6343 [Methylobacterium crusticola]
MEDRGRRERPQLVKVTVELDGVVADRGVNGLAQPSQDGEAPAEAEADERHAGVGGELGAERPRRLPDIPDHGIDVHLLSLKQHPIMLRSAAALGF